MARQKVLLAAGCAVLAGALFVAYRFDPSGAEFPFPRCLFNMLTGWDCPGCGSTRALHAILHGRVGEAWASNPAVFVAMPLIVLCFAAESPRMSGLRRIIFSPVSSLFLIAITIIWTIYRNI